MLGQRTVSRCAECGTWLPAGIDALGSCPQCGTPLHACKQCTHFDPVRRFECAQPVAERIVEKTARNECEAFSLRVTVERDATPGSQRPDEARRAFDGLFRKPSP
jgi:hypothetical protein